ncbi:MAG: hypothetical protein R3C20_24945 [Planctomycetaceae bacterium]
MNPSRMHLNRDRGLPMPLFLSNAEIRTNHIEPADNDPDAK